MNRTHRGLNRLLLGLLGLLLLAAGALSALAGANADVARQWTSTGKQAWSFVQDRLAEAVIPGWEHSWWSAAAFAVLLLIAVLLVCWLASHGGGRTNRLARHQDDAGTTTIDAGVAGQAIKNAVAHNKQILATSVQAWEMAGGSGLKIKVQARKGASPKELLAELEEQVAGLDALLGEPVPVLIRITAGGRSRFAGTERVS